VGDVVRLKKGWGKCMIYDYMIYDIGTDVHGEDGIGGVKQVI
jgi:hypothetical protein